MKELRGNELFAHFQAHPHKHMQISYFLKKLKLQLMDWHFFSDTLLLKIRQLTLWFFSNMWAIENKKYFTLACFNTPHLKFSPAFLLTHFFFFLELGNQKHAPPLSVASFPLQAVRPSLSWYLKLYWPNEYLVYATLDSSLLFRKC